MPGTGMNYYEMMRRQVRDARGWWAIHAAPVLILLVALLLIPASARAYTAPPAASGLTMQVNAGFHTRYRGWVPVYITLRNTGTDFIGTVARTVNYPKQDTTIHTTVETQPWAATIGGKSNQANRNSSRSFPNESGEHGSSSAATATPSQCLYKSLA